MGSSPTEGSMKYRYLIFGTINAIIAGIFTFIAINPPGNFIAGVFAFVFWFIVGHCWNKDSERVINDKRSDSVL